MNLSFCRWLHISLIAFSILTSSAAFMNADERSAQTRFRILIIKTRDIPFYAPAVQGLIDGLKSRGYRSRERVDLKTIALTGKQDADRALVEAQLAAKPDLVVTLGTDATRLTADQKPGMPVLFAMVLDPVRLGVVKSLESPGATFTGITIPVSPGKQLESLLQAAPSVHRIGLLYTEQDPTSLAFLADAEVDASRLHVELISVPVKSNQTAREALARISPTPDAIWLLPDPASSGPQALQESLDYAAAHRLPVLGTSSGSVRSGALLALSANLEDQGSSAAEMAVRILEGTETPAQMRVRGPRRTVLTLNLAVSHRLGIVIPKEVLHLADEVVEAEQEDK